MKKFEVYDNFMQFDSLNLSQLQFLGIIESTCLLNAMIEAKNKYNTFVKLKEVIEDINKPLRMESISVELYSNKTDEEFRIDINIQEINRGQAILNKEDTIKLYNYLALCLKRNIGDNCL